MINKTLSIMPFYGGKARLAKFIADKLDYSDTDIYIEPFGGACRVLLNKPMHQLEIYNDYSQGLTALIGILADEKRAKDFIYKLYYETEYSEEEFNRAKRIFEDSEKNIEQYMNDWAIEEFKEFLKKIGYKKRISVKKLFQKSISNDNNDIEYVQNIINEIVEVCKKYDGGKSIKELHEFLQDNANKLNQTDDISASSLEGLVSVSDEELGMATYIVYTQSRDGMGKAFSDSKTTEKYRKGIEKLFLCAERLKNVQVYQSDAMDFFNYYYDNEHLVSDNKFFNIMHDMIRNPRAMFYCDPSYLKDDKNLGKSYVASFGYEEHEAFLKCICDEAVEAKIMVSNYDNDLYNEYLTEDRGWKRIEFETKTTVGSKKNNKRTEVLWYNY